MPTTRQWIGGEHDFFDPNAWTPAGRPKHGETLIIGPGTPSSPNVADARHVPLNDLTVLLDDGPGLVGSPYIPTLSLSDTTIGRGTLIENQVEPSPALGASDTEAIRIDGTVHNKGTIAENPGALIGNTLNLTIEDGSTLINEKSGTISGTTLSHLNVSGGAGANLVNDGTVSGQGTLVDIGVPVSGSGSFVMTGGPNPGSHTPISATLEFHYSVGADQTVALIDTTLILDEPLAFLATIDDRSVSPPSSFAQDSSILLKDEHATDLAFQDNVLTIRNGGQTLSQLLFAPGLTADDFHLSDTPGGTSIAIVAPPPVAAPPLSPDLTQPVPTLVAHL